MGTRANSKRKGNGRGKIRFSDSSSRRGKRSTLGYVFSLFGVFVLVYVVFVMVGLGWNELATRIDEKGYFELKHVSISGNERTSKELILSTAGLSGYESARMNLLRLDLNRMSSDILGLPWISSVSVNRQLPHTLEIIVEEERPSVIAYFGVNGYWLVNSNGKAFVKIEDVADWSFLPLIEGLDPDELSDAMLESCMPLKEALVLIREWNSLGYEEVELESVMIARRGVIARFVSANDDEKDGFEAVLGEGDFKLKFARMHELYEKFEAKGQRPAWFFLDNRKNPNWVTVKFKDGNL